MSELVELQKKFVRLENLWIDFALSKNFQLTHGEGFVSSQYVKLQANGEYHHVHMSNSLHYLAIAADWNLFVNGVYVKDDCPEWRLLGAKWKSLDPLCRWGGDFSSVDLNHISLLYQGRA